LGNARCSEQRRECGRCQYQQFLHFHFHFR
jgi:hypothetical protein